MEFLGRARAVKVAWATWLGTMGVGVAMVPTFYLIEPFLKVGVLVHFDTEPLYAYDLQATTNLLAATNPGSPIAGPWESIYQVPPYPFPNHFIVPDYFTNAPPGQRFYRLVATP